MDEISQSQVSFSFENLDGNNNVNMEAPAFKKEESEMAEPFLMWHMAVASRYLCCRILLASWLTSAIRFRELDSVVYASRWPPCTFLTSRKARLNALIGSP